MPFLTDLRVMFLDDRSEFPWLTLEPLEYTSELTGQTYIVPRHFRTDGASIPKALIAFPVIGQSLAMRFMGHGVWHGFREGVLHDYLRRPRGGVLPVSASIAHAILREALQDAGYPEDIVENYYAAVVRFNS
jgi:hypothetical protein